MHLQVVVFWLYCYSKHRQLKPNPNLSIPLELVMLTCVLIFHSLSPRVLHHHPYCIVYGLLFPQYVCIEESNLPYFDFLF